MKIKILFWVCLFLSLSNISTAQNVTPAKNKVLQADSLLISLFKEHDVILLGEHHRIKEFPDFVSSIIPILHQNNINLLFSEFARFNDTELINSLITAKNFDSLLAQKIMFKDAWDWGYKELVDVYYSAWKLNANLLPNEPKFRIIGLENYEDSTIIDQESFWAHVIESISIKEGKKSIVYCGIHHAFTNYKHPYIVNDTLNGFVNSRVGNYLYRKYSTKIITVLLHSPINSLHFGTMMIPFNGMVDSLYYKISKSGHSIGLFSDNDFLKNCNLNGSFYGIGYSNFTLKDICQGYIIVKPICELNPISVIPDFINKTNLTETRKVSELGNLSASEFNNLILLKMQNETKYLLELKMKFCNK